MTDVFVKVWASSRMRLAMAWAVVERLAMIPSANVRIIYAYPSHRLGLSIGDLGSETWAIARSAVVLRGENFWVTSKQYAEDQAESPIYVVIDDDHLPIGRTWLEDGVSALEAHPEFSMLSSWSINGEVPANNTGTHDPDVFEVVNLGTPYFVRKGALRTLPAGDDGGAATYDGILSDHVRKQGRIGFLRRCRHNHLGCGYSQVVSGHWSA